MEKYICRSLLLLGTLSCLYSCYGIDEENFRELSPISFNEVSDVIDIPLAEELVYDQLEVISELPCTYEWAYGKRKVLNAKTDYDMETIEVISDKLDIRYAFRRIGQYVLRLRVDNGESIAYKYFILNVNSGLDEGVLVLSNDVDGKGSLTFVQNETDKKSAVVHENVFADINPGYVLKNVTGMYMSDYTTGGIQYTQLLVSTDDEKGRIYKMEPRTFALMGTSDMQELMSTSCIDFAGDRANSAANYVLMTGKDGRTYRYDLRADMVGERTDASAAGSVLGSRMLVYYTTGATSRVPVFYNRTSLFLPGTNGTTKVGTLAGYDIVNYSSKRNENKTYVLFRSQTEENSYVIKYTTGSLAAFKDVVGPFDAEQMTLTEQSKIVGTFRYNDAVYFSNGTNMIYRWSLSVKPSDSPIITLPEGEIVYDIATNYINGAKVDHEYAETLLYIATYNENAANDRKGSLYVYDIAGNSLLAKYEGIFDKPVKIMYKYRVL